MDVHRSRFVPYPIYPITATAFSRSSDHGFPLEQPRPALKLAIGRQNGDVEIWNPLRGKWVQEAVFHGDGRSIDGLTWTREPDDRDVDGQPILGQHRLFSIASSPAVTEWDLQQGRPRQKSTGNFSEVWCFAAQPRKEQKEDETAQSQEIVAGCGDGTIVLLSTADNDLQFKRFVARVPGKKAKCMSITYQNFDRVLAGFMDSTIRVFDTRTGANIRTMSVGTGLPGAPKTAIVWQIRSLANGDFVSGDSNGEVVFWDGRSYSLSQRVKAHDSECLELVAGADGKTVLSGSNNGRLAIFRQTTTANGRRSWNKSHHKKTHDGQIKAMSAFDGDSLSVVVSGGDDFVPVITPLREYGKEHSRTLSTLPQFCPIRSARNARLLVSWWDKSISIWRLARRVEVDTESNEAQVSRKLAAKLSLDVKDCIRSVAISEDGRALAAATSSEIKLFQLRRRPDSHGLSVKKLEVPNALASDGARMLKFSPDGKWLAVVNLENDIQIIRLATVPSQPKKIHILKKVVELERREPNDGARTSFKSFDRSIAQLDFASDSSVLACGDNSGNLDSWVLEGHEDIAAPAIDISKHESREAQSEHSSDSSDEDEETIIFYGQHWTDNPVSKLLPKLESTPLVFSFRPKPMTVSGSELINGNPGVHSTRHNPHAHSHELPKGQHLLWIMTAEHKMHEIDVLQGRLSDWSRRNPASALPADFTNLTERVKGVVWDVSPQRERLWLFSSSWTFMLNMSGDLMTNLSTKKRKAEEEKAAKKRLKTSSGTGLKKPADHRVAMPEKIKRYEDGTWTDMELDKPRVADDDDVDEDEEEEAESRLRLERIASESRRVEPSTNGGSQNERPWWSTYKYRHILGIVPIEDPTATEADKPLEVVIVERPLWDVRREAK